MSEDKMIEIGGIQFAGFIGATARQASNVVAEQKKLYAGGAPAWSYYGPFYRALRGALNAPDPQAHLERVVERAAAQNTAKGDAFRDAAAGFLKLLPAGATGVRVNPATWEDADLTVALRNALGVRLKNGKLFYVMPHAKQHPLSQDGSDAVLRMMELAVDLALPGAVPLVWDLRRDGGTACKLHGNTNRDALDSYLQAQAAAYRSYWNAA
ncbi:hypothetical protein SD37_39535 [Amycolatopsis orientalis]|uniref:Uncharacterized protein n=1 Tax=Amycolatopsis orientalis TaxID=31958 RepID=A0A193C8Z8_AMYOR|nr:hypothetical protein [Amycolatopsis orientalis]ANN21081.1 hypothetical protein SD37_39535 [Amycolatopsis orientalis]